MILNLNDLIMQHGKRNPIIKPDNQIPDCQLNNNKIKILNLLYIVI